MNVHNHNIPVVKYILKPTSTGQFLHFLCMRFNIIMTANFQFQIFYPFSIPFSLLPIKWYSEHRATRRITIKTFFYFSFHCLWARLSCQQSYKSICISSWKCKKGYLTVNRIVVNYCTGWLFWELHHAQHKSFERKEDAPHVLWQCIHGYWVCTQRTDISRKILIKFVGLMSSFLIKCIF